MHVRGLAPDLSSPFDVILQAVNEFLHMPNSAGY